MQPDMSANDPKRTFCPKNEGGMANEGTTVVLGIPIPSTSPVFLAIIGVHVLFGLEARLQPYWHLADICDH
jgi:hypothetical protein